jgi:hypothetical protein
VFWLMSVCRARSLSLFGIDALPVEVEVDVSSGLPGFSIVGLPDAAVQEARERVRVAISNSGYKFPTKKVKVNLAPANLRKEGLLLPAVLKDSSLRADLFSVLLMVLYLRFRGVRGVLRCALIHKPDAAAHEGRSMPGPYCRRTRMWHRRYVSYKVQTAPSYAFAPCSLGVAQHV